MTTPVIPRGGRAAAQRAQAEKEARQAASKQSYNIWKYLTLDPPAEGATELEGESVIIRFVTDEPEFREVMQHSFINTKQAPSDKPADKKWPIKMGAVCRQSPGFDALYDDCWICDHVTKDGKNGPYPIKPSLRLWAVAVEREEVLGTQEMADAGEIEPYQVGDVVGYRDKTQERTIFKDGKPLDEKVTEKVWLVLNFGLDNFFDKVLGFAHSYKNVVDKDYMVTRIGRGTDTDYAISPLEPQTVQVDGKNVKFDLRNPIFAKEYEIPFSLDEIIAEQASDAHYEKFFDTRVSKTWAELYPKRENDESSDSSDGGSASSTPANTANASQAKATVEAMRDRLKQTQKAKANA